MVTTSIAILPFLFFGVLSLLAFVFWIWMIIHCLMNNGLQGGDKVAWILVVLFLPFIGSVIYFFLGRTRRP